MDTIRQTETIDHNRRRLLATAAMGIVAAGAASLFPSALTAAPAGDAVRPFRISIPQEQLADLRRRIAATPMAGSGNRRRRSQGAQLAKLQELVRYWGTGYDWRKVEAQAERLPQFITDDRRRRHPLHPRPLAAPNALPVIVTHGWPGSIIEQLKIIDPLTDPTAHGGSAEDAFDVVIPSVPGLRLLRQADRHRLGSRPHRARLGGADEAPRLHPLRRAGRRLGHARSPARWRARAPKDCSASTSTCRRRCRPRWRRRSTRRAGAGGTFRQGTRGVRRAR